MSGQPLDMLLARMRLRGRTIVFTNGCFDLLHRGHVEYLAKAASLGNFLVVGLNSDESVKRLKGSDRPVLNQETRALMMASLDFVRVVTIFDQDTPVELIKLIRPDILVKGGDYKSTNDVVGHEIVEAYGGSVQLVGLTEGFSTTSLIKKLAEK